MSEENYKRATKRHAVIVSHTDGEKVQGFIPVPVGVDFENMLSQTGAFLPFETVEGESAYLTLQGVKRITHWTEGEKRAERQTAAERPDPTAAKRAAEAQRERARKAAAQQQQKDLLEGATPEEWAYLVACLKTLGLPRNATGAQVQEAYKTLVKKYHPDRIRGLGATSEEVDHAAKKLAAINSAYQALSVRYAAA